MDPGTHPQGTHQPGPPKESRQKRRKSSRPKSSKQPTVSPGSSVAPTGSPTSGGRCTVSPALSPLPGACSAIVSGAAPSQPSGQSKSPPGGGTKSRSSGTEALLPSLALRAHDGKAAAALNKSRPSLDAARSKPSDSDAILGATHRAARPSRPVGVKASGGTESLQDQPPAPAVAASEAAARADVAGAAALGAPVAVSRHPPGAPQPAVQPPRSKQASRRERRKSKAASSTKNRDADVDNRFSAEESFTPASSREAAMKKGHALSSSHWSFYPLNVSFVTETNSKHERYLYAAVVAVLAVLFALAVVALLLLLSPKPPMQYVFCNTAECIEAREYLARLINTSKDTCSDFYGYVCDSWLDRGTEEDGPSSFLSDNMAASISTISMRLFSQEFQAERYKLNAKASADVESTRVLRALYQRCYSYVSEKTMAGAFMATLTSARERLNWTLIRGARTYRELVGLIARTSLLAGFHTVFALDLVTDNGKTVLRLSSEKSLLGKLATSGNRAELESDLRRVVEDADERALILSLDKLIADDLDLGDDGAVEDESRPLRALLENLVPEVSASDWMVALNLAVGFGEATMRASDTSFASGVDNVRSAFSKIYNQSNVSEAALYLASHLDAELLSLELSRERAEAHSSKTAQFCLGLLRRGFGHVWPRLVERLLDLEQSAHVLYAMFHELKETSKHAAIIRWLPEQTRNDAVGKVDRATLIFIAENTEVSALWPP
ncbi:uncharacterized protein LOC144130441 [Amblyomma americanum]